MHRSKLYHDCFETGTKRFRNALVNIIGGSGAGNDKVNQKKVIHNYLINVYVYHRHTFYKLLLKFYDLHYITFYIN